MAHHPILERYLWFDQQIRQGLYPNATDFAGRFELSRKTAQRDIEFLRDRLDAPLKYNSGKRGYCYRDDSFRLPPLFITERQLVTLLLARQVLKIGGCKLDHDLQKFTETLLASVADHNFTLERLDHLFSAMWSGHAPAAPKIFNAVLRALTHENYLCFHYKSPLNDKKAERTVEPHHLQYYQGSWLLLAWCRRANGWRKFYLSRMEKAHVLSECFVRRPPKDWQHHLEGSFGIFQGRDIIWVRLRFSAERSRWIREQRWHEKQEMKTLPDGSLELRLPVADLREIHLRILQYGADVEVLEPQELREMIKQDIRRMIALYKK
jgi:predicted DNA-binding transcriptional regulator YafY